MGGEYGAYVGYWSFGNRGHAIPPPAVYEYLGYLPYPAARNAPLFLDWISALKLGDLK